MGFPGAPDNLDLYTSNGGTVYQFLADHGRWVLYKSTITDHNDMGGIDDGDINHLTDAEVAALHAVYTDAEAVAAAEAAGLALANTKVITSQDGDLLFLLGRVAVGYNGTGDYAVFAHRDNMTAANSAVRQTASGFTLLNCKTGTYVALQSNNSDVTRSSTNLWRLVGAGAVARPNVNKEADLGTAAIAWDDVYADDFTDVASEQKYTVPSDEEIYQELKDGKTPYIKEIKILEFQTTEKNPLGEDVPLIMREEVPLDYIAKEGETLETHHTRSHSHNIDYLNGVIRKLIEKIEALKKIVGTDK